jgi:hypothetical protein
VRSDETRVGGLHLLALTAFAAGVRLAFAWRCNLVLPFGEDAAFWGYDVLQLAAGTYVGDLPPAYPALVLALGGSGTAATAIATIAGVLVAPLVALATEAMAGGRAGRVAGWLAAMLPALFAWSFRVEPTTLVAAGIALTTLCAARAVRDGSPAWGAAFGLLAGALPLVKENGLLVPLALLPVVVWKTPGRVRAVAIACAVAAFGVAAWLETRAAHGGVPGKLAMPASETWALLADGRLPTPLGPDLDVAARLLQPERVGLRDPSPAARAAGFAVVQARRALVFAGPWAIAVPLAVLVLLQRRAGALAVALSACALPLAAIVFQPRHVDVALVGGAMVVGIAVADRRWLGGVAVAVALAWGIFRVDRVEGRRVVQAHRCAHEELDVVTRIRAEAGDGTPLCALERWVGFRLGETTHLCAEGDTPRGAWVIAKPEEIRWTWSKKPGFRIVRRETTQCRGDLMVGTIR